MNVQPRVAFLTLVFSHYREPVHERVRSLLLERGIIYDVLCSDPVGEDASKGDTVSPDWATRVGLKTFKLLGKKLHLQEAVAATRNCELVIVSQENKLLMNYYLMARALVKGKKIAYFGHGRGYQSTSPNGILERWKRFMATRVHWWFAYTPGVSTYLQSIGFPKDRITIFQNSIDTRKLTEEIASADKATVDRFLKKYGIKGKNICLYMGGMYAEKRLEFLCEAALEIRKQVPDFELLLVGSGADAHIAKRYADAHSFIHAPGSLFGVDRASALKLSKLFLMPGLVGLAVIDSFVGKCPLITTEYPHHSPEIEYLESGKNGLIIENDGQARTYADAVSSLLNDSARLKVLEKGCEESAKIYTTEAMADRLADGICEAIGRE